MEDLKAVIGTLISELNRLKEMSPVMGNVKDSVAEPEKEILSLPAREDPCRIILENIPQKIFLKDKDAAYLFCNGNYARGLKIEPKEIFGRTDYDFFPEKIAARFARNDQWVLTRGEPRETEIRDLRNGEERFALLMEIPLRDAQGEVTGIVGMIQDITEQKRTEKEVEEYRARLEELAAAHAAELRELRKQLKGEISEGQKIGKNLPQREGTVSPYPRSAD